MKLLKFPSRQTQLWILILLSAATMIIPYFIQGFMSSGKSPLAIPQNIWNADHWFWSIRAMVEGLVISYIAVTKTEDRKQNIILWSLKIALITLIAFTLGPVMYASLNGLQMSQALNTIVQWLWSIGLASYMPLMVLGASYAYKVQPSENGSQTIVENLQTDFNTLQSNYNRLKELDEKTQSKLKALQDEHKAIAIWQQLSITNRAMLVYQNTNGDKPTVKELAALWKCSESAVRYGYDKAKEGK